MQLHPTACRALTILALFAAVPLLPSGAQGQCESHFELFAAAAPRNLNFAFFEPTSGRVIATETPYVGATSSDTWSWDGTAWQRLASGNGPMSVLAATVAWDSARQRAVALNANGQTWEWDGSAWSHPADCPSTRCSGAAITYDAGRAVTLMVTGGGTPGGPAAETWEWNGSTWAQRVVSGPGNRKLHTLTYDPVRHVSVLIGGQIDNTMGPPAWLGDVWEFDGTSWTQRTFTGGPGTVSEQGAVYHAAYGGVVLFGGRNFNLKTQMMSWNGTAWTTINAVTPGPQQDTSLMSDPAGSRLLMLGRIILDGAYAQHRWQLFTKPDASVWSTVCRADDFTPSTGYQSSACYDSDRGVMVVFGGVLQTGDGRRDDTTWEYDGVTWHKRPAAGPSPRSQASMAYDPVRHRVVMVGGYTGTTTRPAETWEYDGTAWTLVSTSTVGARNGAALTYDPVRGKMVMHGGRGTGDTFLTDTQTWDGASWTQIATNAPSWYGFTAFDQGAQAVIGAFLSGGTRRLDGGSWTPLSASLFSDPFAWDASYGRLVGYQGTAGPGLRSWNGSTWQTETISGISLGVRDGHSVVYDSAHGHTLVFGGWSGGYYTNEVWNWIRPTADMGRAGGLPGPDGHLDNNDFIVFISRFFANSPLADVGKQGGLSGSDNQLDNNDFIAFINLFFNGCGV